LGIKEVSYQACPPDDTIGQFTEEGSDCKGKGPQKELQPIQPPGEGMEEAGKAFEYRRN